MKFYEIFEKTILMNLPKKIKYTEINENSKYKYIK